MSTITKKVLKEFVDYCKDIQATYAEKVRYACTQKIDDYLQFMDIVLSEKSKARSDRFREVPDLANDQEYNELTVLLIDSVGRSYNKKELVEQLWEIQSAGIHTCIEDDKLVWTFGAWHTDLNKTDPIKYYFGEYDIIFDPQYLYDPKICPVVIKPPDDIDQQPDSDIHPIKPSRILDTAVPMYRNLVFRGVYHTLHRNFNTAGALPYARKWKRWVV